MVLTRVLIWALLLCHGVFGALHVATDPTLTDDAPAAIFAGEHAAAHHASGYHDGSGRGDHQAAHAAAEYFAVLLGTFFGGLALWWLRREAPRPGAPFRGRAPSRNIIDAQWGEISRMQGWRERWYPQG